MCAFMIVCDCLRTWSCSCRQRCHIHVIVCFQLPKRKMLILLIDIMKDSGSWVLCRIVVVVLLPSFVVWWCHDAHIVVARSRYKVDMKVEYHLSFVRHMHSGQYCLLECTHMYKRGVYRARIGIG